MFSDGICVLIALAIVSTGIANAQGFSSIESQEHTQCEDERFIAKRKEATLQKRVKQRPKYVTSHIPKRSVLVDVSEYKDALVDFHSLPMQLNQIRSKSYLRLNKVVLVGTGFDDERLIEEAEALELNGFRDVKVLVDGRRSSPTKALTTLASSWFPNEYTLIVWNEYSDLLTPLGIIPIKLDQPSYQQQLEGLLFEIDRIGQSNQYAKFLLATPDEKVYKRMIADSKLNGRNNIWFVAEGESGLIQAIVNTRIDPKRMRNHKFACGNG